MTKPDALDELQQEIQELEEKRRGTKVVIQTGDELMDRVALAEASGEEIDLMDEFFGADEAERIREKYGKGKKDKELT